MKKVVPIEFLKRAGIWLLKNASWVVPSLVGAVKKTIELFIHPPNKQQNERKRNPNLGS